MLVSSVRAVGPYLNFFVNKSALAAGLIPQILDGKFLAPRPKLGVRMMVEYSQPNTHKAFHVGHIRCAALGDTLIRIFEWTGTEVVASNYLGDEGTHVAKCLWYYTEIYKGETPATNRGEFLGTLYTAANDLVDLSTLTRAPFPGVVAARVLTVSAHPEEKGWLVATVDTGADIRTVVTATRGFAAGDVVPIALPGTKVADRAIGVAKRGSVVSEGMLCNAAELSLSEDTATIYQLPKDTALGTEVAELFRITGALPADRSVIAEWRARSEAVSKVLQKLEAGDPKLKEIWATTKDWSMQEFYAIYSWLDCRFDHYFFESELAEPGKELVREYQSRGIFKEDQGAIGVDLSEFGLGFCIVLKRDGTANYATRDLALARRKFEEYKIDRSLYIVDIAQTHHFQQVFKVLELMGFPQAKQCHHLAYAQVVRPDGKMSSRKGNVILFSELQERLLSKIQAEFLDKYRGDWSEEEIATAAHRLALATMRYGMLSPDTSSAVIFDLDDWTSRTGNTGPYLMYACARIYSVLREVGEVTPTGVSWELLAHDSEVNLILHLNRYQEVILHAANSYSPHNLAAYLYELSKKFSTMYGFCSVMNAETVELRQARACLIKSVVLVLEHGLGLLGIKTVQRM